MSTVTLWTRPNPFVEFDALARNAFGAVAVRPTGFVPAAEIVRDGADAVVRVELPGVDVEKDVTVELVKDQLVVRGERRDERAEERNGHSLREVRYGSFRRSFSLPRSVSTDAVTASYDVGVLSIRVSGVYADQETRRIAITSGVTA